MELSIYVYMDIFEWWVKLHAVGVEDSSRGFADTAAVCLSII